MKMASRVGNVELVSPVLTASGTAGYGDELAGYGDLSTLGAVVVKSLAAFEWAGNPAPRVVASGSSMVNSVGLSGPGVAVWRRDHLPALVARGATVVASIWGRRVSEYAEAARELRGANVAAVEVNVSCPNVESRSTIFAHSTTMTAEVVAAARECELPLWVKLSPNTPELIEIADAAISAGASALVLVNTVLGLEIDVENRRVALGAGRGGVSGPGLLPVSLRAVYDCREAFADVGIVGVGGVSSGRDAIAMAMAGADVVEVGSATFADPRAPWRVTRDIEHWMRRHGVATWRELRSVAHG